MSSTTTLPLAAPEQLFTRPFVMLGIADLAYFTADGVAIYALPLYVTGPVGSDTAGAGLAFGAFAVSALVLRPFAGRLADTHGRRPVLLAGALLCALGMLVMPYAAELAPVVALRLVLGVAEAAFFVAAVAALADLAPPSRMGEALSYNSLGLYLGLAAGPPLGEALVRMSGFEAAWVGASALAVLAAVLVLGIGETRVASEQPEGRRALIHWRSLPIALAFFTSVLAMGGFLAFATLRAGQIGLELASLPIVTYGMVVVVGRIACAKVVDRLPPLRLGAASLVLMAAGLVVMSASAGAVGMLVGTGLLGLGMTFSTPAFFAAIFAAAGPGERGVASGTATAFIDLGAGGGPIVLGFVAHASGIPGAFLVAAAISGVGAAWSLLLDRRTKAPPPPHP